MQSTYIPLIGNRYLVTDVLGQGGMGAVYRAFDRLSGATVAVKILPFEPSVIEMITTSGYDPRLTLTREFQTLATLRHPHIVSVLDYGFDAQQQPFFTMEYFSDATNIVAYAHGRSTAEQLSLFWQALQALRYLHQRGTLHCDLKPDNILITADGTLKLLDFGLATSREQLQDSASYGTLPYMAPEMFDDQPYSESSDLYALGLVFYEVISGSYPFRGRTPDALIESIRHDTLDVDTLHTDPAIKVILARLLKKSPAERYPDVEAVLNEYAQLTDTPLPTESATIRDSFLQAARFVGRESELAQLNSALDALKQGSGSAWLIGGESGVGKSRLVDELRVRTLLKGVQVLHAQTAPENAAPFNLWREPLRVLLLDTEVSDLEAGVLATIVPDVEQLVGRSVPPIAPIDPQAAKARLVNTIVELFSRQSQPHLLLIEDMQWVEDSLTVIERLIGLVDKQPLVIVGNYRNDERPSLPKKLPGMHLITLNRLARNEIGDLTVSMLGEKSGRRADLIAFLQQQTEGNIFFVVETVRALVEEAGRLHAVGAIDLPDNLVAVGVRDVLQRRLSRIAPEDLFLMQIAAVNGRVLDQALLGAIASNAEADAWLARNAAIFEVRETEWRFAHDKLREGVLVDILPGQLPRIHRLIAEALDYLGGNDPAYSVRLALHWGKAGDTQHEMQHSALAGAYLLRQGAAKEAMRLLERAYTLADRHMHSALWRAQLTRSLADGSIAIGKPQKNIQYLNESLFALHAPTLPEAATIAERMAMPIVIDVEPIPLETRATIIDTAITLGYSYIEMTTNVKAGVDAVLLATALQESLGVSLELADSDALLAMTLQTVRLPERAAQVAERAAAILDELPDPEVDDRQLPRMARALSNLAYYETFAAHWVDSERHGERAAALFARSGDFLRQRGTWMNLAVANEWRGNFQRGMEMRQHEYGIALRSGDVYGQVRALAGVGQMQATLGDLAESVASFEHRAQLVATLDNPSSTRYTYLSMIYWRLGRVADAQTAIVRAVAEVGLIAEPTGHDLFSIPNTAEVLLGLWEANLLDSTQIAEFVPGALSLVERYGAAYKSGEAQMAVLIGLHSWLRGEPDQAMAHWQHALIVAAGRGNRYAEGLAHYEIARHLPIGDPARRDHIAAARALFTDTGAKYDLGRLNALLA